MTRIERDLSTKPRVLEGEWPADRGFVTDRYPCLAAFAAMWYSEEYQKKLVQL